MGHLVATKAMQVAITGQSKGYGLAVMVEVLSGIMARTGIAARERPNLNSALSAGHACGAR